MAQLTLPLSVLRGEIAMRSQTIDIPRSFRRENNGAQEAAPNPPSAEAYLANPPPPPTQRRPGANRKWRNFISFSANLILTSCDASREEGAFGTIAFLRRWRSRSVRNLPNGVNAIDLVFYAEDPLSGAEIV